MNTSKLRVILYFIVLVIISTIAIQVYWNYKNYQINKQQLINDVQVSLDKAVNTYYENLTKENTLGFIFNEDLKKDSLKQESSFTRIVKSFDINNNKLSISDSLTNNPIEGITIFKGIAADSIRTTIDTKKNNFNLSDPIGKAKFEKFKDSIKKLKETNRNDKVKLTKNKDSFRISNLEFLTSQIVISMTNDSLDVTKTDSIFKTELNRKKIGIEHQLKYYPSKEDKELNTENSALSVVSKSTFLPENSLLKVSFKNETKVILKRIFSGILISTMLVLAVISCLFYLLKIINKQKQLAEVKNDLISNITHEFKTPIATIGVALESIRDFNVIDDKEKTKKYLELSNNQLSKLNIMVEKLLETATLDSENLELNKENIDIAHLLNLQVEKHQLQTQEKTLGFNASAEEIIVKIDVFHFENAINNIIDNAVKYGGDSILVTLFKKANSIEISISDNGNTLTKEQANQIFEKFYRVPKGNTHDVKGFGIGLYYTKKIVEKHNGTINVSLNKGTTFKIAIPNE